MDKQTKDEIREYNRGMQDALAGRKPYDGFSAGVSLLTLGMGGGARPGSSAYWEGYKDGKEIAEKKGR